MISIILITPESIPTTPTILHPNPGSYVISKEIDTYRTRFSDVIEGIITEQEWHELMCIPYTEVSTTLPSILEKLEKKIRIQSMSQLERKQLAA